MGRMIIAIIVFFAGIMGSIVIKASIKSEREKIKAVKEEIEESNKEGNEYRIERLKETLESHEDICKCRERNSKLTFVGCMIVAAIMLVLSVIAVVPTGHTGVKITFGKVEDDVLPSGLNFILPWQNVVNMDNREQKVPFTLEAFSKDIQQVDVQGSINVNIDKPTAMNLYKDVGQNYMDILVQPRVLEDVKIVIARYTAEKLIENRQNAADAIYEIIKKELAAKGINVISFAIENVDFTDTFESAVEAKQVATQEKLKAQTEQEKQTMEMQQKAERDRIQAQAAADVQKIDADAKAYAVKVQAEAQAQANKEIAATLSESLIKYNMVQQWNGKLPVVSSDAMNIIDLSDLETTENTEQ